MKKQSLSKEMQGILENGERREVYDWRDKQTKVEVKSGNFTCSYPPSIKEEEIVKKAARISRNAYNTVTVPKTQHAMLWLRENNGLIADFKQLFRKHRGRSFDLSSIPKNIHTVTNPRTERMNYRMEPYVTFQLGKHRFTAEDIKYAISILPVAWGLN